MGKMNDNNILRGNSLNENDALETNKQCELCTVQSKESSRSSMEVGGPVWLGDLHDQDFLKAVSDELKDNDYSLLTEKSRINGFLKTLIEEVNIPFGF